MAGDDENPYTMPPRPGSDGAPRTGPTGPGSVNPGSSPTGAGQNAPSPGAAPASSAPPPAPGVRHGPAVAPPATAMSYTQDGEPEPTAAVPRRKSRLLPLLVAFLALGGFAAIVWYAYSWGTGEVPPGELPVVTAERDLGEVKERPEEPGGMEVPHQDAQVLNERAGSQPEGPAGSEQVERLLPPPESPQPPEPVAAPQAEPDPPAAEDGRPSVAELPTVPPAEPRIGATETPDATEGLGGEPSEDAAAESDSISDQTVEVAEQPVVPPTAPTDTQAVAPDTTPSAEPTPEQSTTPSPPEAAPAAETEPAAPEPVAEAAPQQPAAPEPGPAPVRSGDWVLQMAALRDQAAVDAEWARLQARHPDLLGGLSLATQTVNLEGQGVFHRLQAGPLPNRATASDLCGLLKAAGTDCLVKQH